MSLTLSMILAGAAGGAMWAGVTLAATWWFNRRVRRGSISAVPTTLLPPLNSEATGGRHVYVRGRGYVYVPLRRVR